MDENTMLGFLPVDAPQDENLLAPMPTDERAIQGMVGIPDAPTERLRTRMNPEGAAPRGQMTFGENIAGQFRSGTILGAGIENNEATAARTGGENLKNRAFQPAQLAQLPTRVRQQIMAEEAALTPEAKAKRLSDATDKVFEQAAFDLSQARFTPASVAAGIGVNILAPENFIALPTRAATAISSAVARRLPSASPAIVSALTVGASGAFGNVVTDPLVQGVRIQSGAQADYDPIQTALAGVTGFAAGAALSGAGSAISKAFSSGDVPKVGVAPEAAKPTPPQTEPPRIVDAAPVDATAPRADGEARIPEPPAARGGDPVITRADATKAAVEPVEAPGLIGVAPPRMAAHSVSTVSGQKIDVAPVIIEASMLRSSSDAGYNTALQPRDRSRAASDAQIRDIAANLDPERLGFSAEADRGAPIVGPDGMVESGNGRVSAIRSAYQGNPESAQRYRNWLSSIGVDVSKFREPVLVRQRLTDFTPEQRQQFTVDANRAATLELSPVERAKVDAGNLTPPSFDLIRNTGEFGAAANRDFFRAFAQSLPPSERGSFMAADGSVSSAGVSRMRNAVLARAYGDVEILARVAESTDDDIKSISNALVAASPEWAKLRAEIDAGAVRADVDQSASLAEAVNRTADLRASGRSLDAFERQQDAFDQVRQDVLAWMRMFYRPDGKRAAGSDVIAERLRYYAQEARKVSADEGLFFDAPPVRAADLQAASSQRGAKYAAGQQAGLFDGGATGAGRNTETGGSAGRERKTGADGGGSAQALGRNPASRAAGESIADIQPMARTAQPRETELIFDRQVLQGEASKPITMPSNATPDEIASFRVTEAIQGLAERLGRKVEMDGRFTARNAAGEYKVKDGVIRLREVGDFETFAHEAGHAIDADMRRTLPAEWKALIKEHVAELRKLDANTSDPAKQSPDEGIAEFIRAYVTNPAYARRNMAPNFAEAFDRFVLEKKPQLAQWFQDASRASEIDNGLLPTQQLESQIVNQVKPNAIKHFRQTAKKDGLGVAFRDMWDGFNYHVIGKDQPVYRLVEELKSARYEKTGAPMPRDHKWDDPYKRFRKMPGAEQGALRAIWDGVANYHDPLGAKSPSLHASLSMALGRVERISDPDDALVKSFNGYLIARRAASLYQRYNQGDLQHRPVRMNEANVVKAIADYEAANPNFRSAADGVFGWTRAYLERKRDAGLIPQDIYDAITGKGEDYVPFYRDVQDLKSGGSPGSAPSLEKGGQGKKLKGSTRDILDPLQSLFIDAIRTERLIARNDFVKSLHLLAQQAGELGGRFVERIPNSELKAQSFDMAEAFRAKARALGMDKLDAETMIREMEEMIGDDLTATIFRASEITPKGERIMFYWDGGERVALKTGQDRYSSAMFDLVSEMSSAERDLFMGFIGKANTYFTQMITNAPQFALKNLIMDNMSRIFIARNTGAEGRIPFASIMRGVYTTMFDREFTKAYEQLGGIRGGVAAAAVRETNTTKGFAGVAAKPQSIGQGLRDLGDDIKDPVGFVRVVAKSPVDLVKNFVKLVEATETIGRVGQAKIVYNHLKKQGLSDDEALHGALFEARDILDYDRFGASTTTIRRFMPFTNVAFQGTSRANQNLFTDPVRAVAQWNARGRDWSKVDGNLQTAFADGLTNWGMIAAALAMTAGYHAAISETDLYQRASPYMKRRYWLVPVPGSNGNGDMNYMTIPKPFDVPGSAISAFEATLEWMRTGDPEGYKKISSALKDGFVPRQFEDIDAFLGAQPQYKIMAELATGRTVPFEGGKPRDIVPRSLQSLPPGMQFTGRSSWLSKTLGEAIGVSPVKVDHIINSLGATAGRDVNDALTGAFDKNPNMTAQDAFTKMFFGGLYRRQQGVGAPGNAIREAMGQDGGKYVVAANSYRQFIETGDRVNAEKAYSMADNLGKTVMTFRGHAFAPAERQLHPLERAEAIASIASSITRDLSASRVQVQDRSRKRGEEREFIKVSPDTARALTTAINAMAAEEILSGLKIAGVPGYQNGKVINGSERLAYIRALSPEVADEIDERIRKSHIIPIDKVEKNWPEVQRRLLQDRESARFRDLLPGVKLPKARR